MAAEVLQVGKYFLCKIKMGKCWATEVQVAVHIRSIRVKMRSLLTSVRMGIASETTKGRPASLKGG